MTIEIIAIGNELLQGYTVNSNAQFLSRSLLNKGYTTQKHIVISDDPEHIKLQLKNSLSKSTIVIVCGGLGPTLDDNTKKCVSELLNQKLRLNKEIYSDLTHRFPTSPSLEEQATVPEQSYALKNEVGTAPGLIFSFDTSCLIVIPGVPSELQPMFEKQVLPFLENNYPLQERIVQQEVGIFLTAEIKIDPILRNMQNKHPEIEIGIYPSLGYVKVRFTYKGQKQEMAKQLIQKLINNLTSQFEGYLFTNSLEQTLHELFLQKNKKLMLAESCTGGAMASRITALSNASKYFLGSIVCYSNEIKQSLLHVQKSFLQTKGAVSKEVVTQMLQGLFEICDTDFAIAISGIAGPSGGTKDKPVGTVYVGVAERGEIYDVGIIHVKGDRDRIIQQTVNVGFSALIRRIKYNKLTFKEND